MKRQGAIIVLFIGILFYFSFMIGYKVMDHRAGQRYHLADNSQERDAKGGDLDLEILKEEERISPNTSIEVKIHYTACNHRVTRFLSADHEIINMTEDEFLAYMEDKYPDIKIISFSPREIILSESKDHLCSNHYIVGEYQGYIAIYGIDDEGGKYLDKVFRDYPISLLKEIDQKKLIDGILVDSEEELSDVLENFIS